MKRNIIIVIVVISIVTAGTLVALIPVFIYGFGVNALSIDMVFGLLGSPSSSSTGSYETMDFGGSSSLSVDVNAVKIGPYEYFFRQFEGEVRTSGIKALQILNQYVDFVIYINIMESGVKELH